MQEQVTGLSLLRATGARSHGDLVWGGGDGLQPRHCLHQPRLLPGRYFLTHPRLLCARA